MSQDILAVVEHQGGAIADVTFELLGLGRTLATATGGRLLAGLLGSGVRGSAAVLGAADAVLSVDNRALKDFNPGPCVAALEALVRKSAPRLVLVPNTSMGMDLAAALAVRCDLPLVASATAVSMEGAAVVVESRLYGGKIGVESVIDGPGGVVSVLAGSFPSDAGRKSGAPPVEDVPAPAGLDAGGIRFLELVVPEAGDVDITSQDVLVGIGRGIQSDENVPLAQGLADVLGGAVCASRPIIDSKWLPKSRQVGKSGLKVKPRIYVALGISGAPEHLEGMKDAELIVAVNTDAAAPIFDVAHFGTTTDLFELVPALTARLK